MAAKDEKTGLCLSLDWCKQQRYYLYSCIIRFIISCSTCSQPVLAVSDSIGRISTVEVTDSGARVLHGWQAHEFEAWIAAFGHQPYMVYSGGDDCKLRVWDLRTGFIKPSFTIKRYPHSMPALEDIIQLLVCHLSRYQMGVCSLQIHPRREHILAAGRYVCGSQLSLSGVYPEEHVNENSLENGKKSLFAVLSLAVHIHTSPSDKSILGPEWLVCSMDLPTLFIS